MVKDLVDIANEIHTVLTTIPPPGGWQANLEVPTEIKCEKKTNPLECFEKPARGIYVCPMVTEYDFENALGRDRKIQIIENPVVQLIISIPYDEYAPGDVVTWEQSCKYIRLRSQAERLIIGNISHIVDVDPAPPVQLGENLRFYMTTTDFIFQSGACPLTSEVAQVTSQLTPLMQRRNIRRQVLTDDS